MRKKWIGMCILGVFIMINTGCTKGSEGTVKKVIIEEDVQLANQDRQQHEYVVEVEEVFIEAPDNSGFRPIFYQNGEWYGTLGGGIGERQPLQEEKYPVDGFIKERLYAIGESGEIRETSKKALFQVYSPSMVEYSEDTDGVKKALSVDYRIQDIPEPVVGLSKAIETIEGSIGGVNDRGAISEYTTQEGEQIHTIRQGKDESTYYFYNETQDKLYTEQIKIAKEMRFYYIDAWGHFIGIDEDQQMYKVVFSEEHYILDLYLDLSIYLQTTEHTKEIRTFTIDDSKLMFIQLKELRTEGYFTYHPIKGIESVGIFDLETNQYDELIRAKEAEYLYINSLGNVQVIGGDMFILDSFEIEEGYLLPQTRQIQILQDRWLQTIYEEDITEEGKTLSPYVLAEINEDGSEIFLAKDQTELQGTWGAVETSIGRVYKRYTLK